MSKIFVSAGHGGSDSGACSQGFKEKDLNLSIVLELQKYLQSAGHTVVMNRTSDVNGFSKAVSSANASKADAFIEVHHNAGGGTGSEAFYYQHDTSDKPGPRMAAEVCKELAAAFGWPNRGAKKAAGNYDFAVVRETTMPAIVCEVCFIDSPGDMGKWNAKKAALAIAKGLCNVWGGAVKEEQDTQSTEAEVLKKEIETLKKKISDIKAIVG